MGQEARGLGCDLPLRMPRTLAAALSTAAVALAGGVVPVQAASQDGRAYELVSPVDKHGADVTGDPSNTRVSVTGDAISYPSLGAFADAIGTGLIVNYVSVRTARPGTNGWDTHAITPYQEPASFGNAVFGVSPFYVGDFSPDLARGAFRALTPVTDAPNVEQTRNLYVRSDVLTPGPGTYELVTDSAFPIPPAAIPGFNTYRPFFGGGSADLTHVVFETTLRLTPTAPVCDDPTNPTYGCGMLLYEWVDGAVRLVGILPDGIPATTAVVGRGASNRVDTRAMTSREGSRIFFTDSATGSGDVFARIGGQTTVQLNASE